ncbi:methionyl-tRNA synthetase [Jackrogersella minutella]|nr:methionyl-tRNA synthetase [Jackrogersella minutella]
MKCHWGVSSRQLSIARAGRPLRNSWICQSCRSSQTRRKLFSSSASANTSTDATLENKPYYITTPIFYVNSTPHIGHLYSMVVADVLKRWQVLKGKQAILSTGTDEHGLKVQRAAEAQDIQPKALCDANSEMFKDLAKKANISYDRFIRTTDPEHRDAVEYAWARLKDAGYIYEKKHEGWYCVSDETFYPETMIAKRVSPTTGKPITTAIETGNEVEWTSERNYHFRLTAFREKLLSFYAENNDWMIPYSRYKEIIDWVQNNLEDLSISRPASRLGWGIPVPDDPDQVIYVWVDALINYITVAGYPNWPPGLQHTGGWPADVHVVGKDIIRFHAVYWPALLMALDLPLPKGIHSHGHWLMNQKKMSKSVGNVVNPFFALDRWGVDSIRFFMMYIMSPANDANYSNGYIVRVYNKWMRNNIGNLLNRITRPAIWSVRDTVVAMNGKDFSELPGGFLDQKQAILLIARKVDQHMVRLNPRNGLMVLMEFVATSNAFLHDAEPWKLIKEDDTLKAQQVVYILAESLRMMGILLQPYIPDKASEFLDILGVSPDRRSLRYAMWNADDTYGTPLVELQQGAQGSLFPPPPVED